MNIHRSFAVFCCLFLVAFSNAQVKRFYITGFAQGTTYAVIYFENDSIVKKHQVDSLLVSIDSSLSLYKPYSVISRFNRSDTGLAVDEHFIKVVNRSLEIYHRTNGAFDITVKPLVDAWGFGVERNYNLPSKQKISELLSCIGSSLLQIEGSLLKKKKRCVQIDLNGIAQGYSVDVVAEFLEGNGITDFLVELGGEIRVKGKRQPENLPMRIGIESPSDDNQLTLVQKVVEIKEGAITSSGNYRKFYESDGKKITHIIDPKSGNSVQSELITVTVYAKDAITADGYDNALMVLGLEKALDFVEANKEISAYFIYRSNDGTIKAKASSRFENLFLHDEPLP